MTVRIRKQSNPMANLTKPNLKWVGVEK